jgi:ABC-type phosphate transport system substrate-binding protein
VLGRDVQAVKGYWQQAIFAGKNFPPLEKSNDAEVMAFVAANPNAIGYVSPAALLPGTVKVIRVEE